MCWRWYQITRKFFWRIVLVGIIGFPLEQFPEAAKVRDLDAL